MIDRTPPVDTHPALRAGVDALLALEPDYDVDAGAQRFEHALRSGPASTPGISPRGRLAIVTVVVAVVGAGLFGAWPSELPSTPTTGFGALAGAPPPVTPPPVRTDAVAIVAQSDPPRASTPVAEPAKIATKPRRSRTRASSERAVVPAEPDDTLAREMALLDTTRRQIVSGKASSASATIEVARTSLARLRFDEEWDALEILALAGRGELARAESRASAFLAAHPNGRFNASIEAALERARR